MRTGTCKWFSDDRGYGFITPDAGGGDVFVHWSGIEGREPGGRVSLTQGQRVSYDVRDGAKGTEACSVTLLP